METRKLRSEWLRSIAATALGSLVWIYCPGLAGVQGNERADSLVGDPKLTDNIEEDKAEILMRVSISLREGEEREVDNYYSITRMKELGIRKGEGRKFEAEGKARRMRNQFATGTISLVTLRGILERGTMRVLVCPECHDGQGLDNVFGIKLKSRTS